jgi:hypothetical protein
MGLMALPALPDINLHGQTTIHEGKRSALHHAVYAHKVEAIDPHNCKSIEFLCMSKNREIPIPFTAASLQPLYLQY